MGIVLLASPTPEPVAKAQHKSNTTPANEARLRSHSTSKDDPSRLHNPIARQGFSHLENCARCYTCMEKIN